MEGQEDVMGKKISNKEQLGGRVANIRHIGIAVSDMEASLTFYTRFFGLRLGNSSMESGVKLDQILGIPNVRLRIQKLLTDTGDSRLELVEFLEPKHVKDVALDLTDVGITHFAITVYDIELIYKEMLKAGVPFIAHPQIEATGFAKIMFCRDPDGNLIELIEVQRKDSSHGS